MIAYNELKFSNLLLLDQLKRWKRAGLLDAAMLSAIAIQKAETYKHTNIFLRIGVFILTMILSWSITGIAFLFFDLDSEIVIGVAMIFFGLLFGAALEFFIRKKSAFCSGVDDALLYFSATGIIVGIAIVFQLYKTNSPELYHSILICLALMPAAIRYVDRFLALLSYIAVFCVFFFGIPHWFGMNIAKLVLPFFTMALSISFYMLFARWQKRFELRFYKHCLMWLSYAALFSFYAGGNYYVVRELSTSYFDIDLKPGQDIPLAWFFQLFTVLVPVVLIALGLKNKNKPMIISGLILCAAAVATIRYYYSVMPVEWALTLGGLAMILVAVIAHYFFRKKTTGITYEEDVTDDPLISRDLEAIFIAQVLRKQMPDKTTEFGGGEFGGGGAGSTI